MPEKIDLRSQDRKSRGWDRKTGGDGPSIWRGIRISASTRSAG